VGLKYDYKVEFENEGNAPPKVIENYSHHSFEHQPVLSSPNYTTPTTSPTTSTTMNHHQQHYQTATPFAIKNDSIFRDDVSYGTWMSLQLLGDNKFK
jgi:hypothetical protein